VTSRAQIDELSAVLARPRIQKYVAPDDATSIVENIDTRAEIVETLPEVHLSPDPKDNPILATAIAGQSDLIVSGDKNHLLALEQVEGIVIVTAREALARIRNE
jgi:putative PIN family toxin of toxin-antitoxin system